MVDFYNLKKVEKGIVEFELPDSYVSNVMDMWNENYEKCKDLIMEYNPKYVEYFNPNNCAKDNFYEFKVEFKERKIYSLLELTPKGQVSVDYKLLRTIYKELKLSPEVRLMGEVSVLINVFAKEHWYTLAGSCILNPDTGLDVFLDHFKKQMENFKNYAYPFDAVEFVSVKIFKLSDKKGESNAIKPSKGSRAYSTIGVRKNRNDINPLVKKEKYNEKIGVLDIETVVVNNIHIPYAIGYMVKNNKKMFYLADYGSKFSICKDKMMRDFINNFLIDCQGHYIYVHNLGSFDGYFLLKEFEKYVEDLDILMDKQNKFISIDLKNGKSPKTKFRDSLRIFPSSLDSLSQMFDVPIKKSSFDHDKVNKNIIFDEKFKQKLLKYLNNDLVSLYDIIHSAANFILEEYGVDLTNCYSASSLAIRIYRTRFQKEAIPILPPIHGWNCARFL